MTIENKIRIDKWLWAVRIFKTRNQAAEACKKGQIQINKISVKPSYSIKLNDIIEVRKNPIIKTFKVVGLLEKRQSAKIVVDYVKDLTTEEEMQKIKQSKDSWYYNREKGAGRPTKKERRIIDSLNQNLSINNDNL